MKLPIALALAGLSIVSGVAYGASPDHAQRLLKHLNKMLFLYCQSNINHMLQR